MNILVIHGPNLNLLGRREPALYGARTLKEIDALLKRRAAELGAALRCFQTNYEGRILDLLEEHAAWAGALVINPGALTHYSYALHDCIKGLSLKAVEVHLTDISKREPWRRRSVIKPVCAAQFKGEGPGSYLKAVEYCVKEFGGKRPAAAPRSSAKK